MCYTNFGIVNRISKILATCDLLKEITYIFEMKIKQIPQIIAVVTANRKKYLFFETYCHRHHPASCQNSHTDTDQAQCAFLH